MHTVYLLLHEGKTQRDAAEVVAVHRQVVNRWIRLYCDEGAVGLRSGRRVSSRKGIGVLTALEGWRVQRWIWGDFFLVHLNPRRELDEFVARQSGWEGSDNQDGHFGGRGGGMIVAARR
jgi:hypothetical protein